MRPARRLTLPRAALFVLFLLDVVAAIAFVLDQWFAMDPSWTWTLSALWSLPVAIGLWPMIDRLVSRPVATRDIHFPGDKIPGAGQ